jgi:hypothetical protein
VCIGEVVLDIFDGAKLLRAQGPLSLVSQTALFALKPMPMVLTFVAMQLVSALSLRGKRRLTD